MDEPTSEARAVEISGSEIGNAPVLLAQISKGEPIVSVTADGSHDTHGCRDAIANRGAEAINSSRSRGRETILGRKA